MTLLQLQRIFCTDVFFHVIIYKFVVTFFLFGEILTAHTVCYVVTFPLAFMLKFRPVDMNHHWNVLFIIHHLHFHQQRTVRRRADGSKTPPILHPCTRRLWVLSFTLRPLHFRCPSNRRQGIPRVSLARPGRDSNQVVLRSWNNCNANERFRIRIYNLLWKVPVYFMFCNPCLGSE